MFCVVCSKITLGVSKLEFTSFWNIAKYQENHLNLSIIYYSKVSEVVSYFVWWRIIIKMEQKVCFSPLHLNTRRSKAIINQIGFQFEYWTALCMRFFVKLIFWFWLSFGAPNYEIIYSVFWYQLKSIKQRIPRPLRRL